MDSDRARRFRSSFDIPVSPDNYSSKTFQPDESTTEDFLGSGRRFHDRGYRQGFSPQSGERPPPSYASTESDEDRAKRRERFFGSPTKSRPFAPSQESGGMGGPSLWGSLFEPMFTGRARTSPGWGEDDDFFRRTMNGHGSFFEDPFSSFAGSRFSDRAGGSGDPYCSTPQEPSEGATSPGSKRGRRTIPIRVQRSEGASEGPRPGLRRRQMSQSDEDLRHRHPKPEEQRYYGVYGTPPTSRQFFPNNKNRPRSDEGPETDARGSQEGISTVVIDVDEPQVSRKCVNVTVPISADSDTDPDPSEYTTSPGGTDDVITGTNAEETRMDVEEDENESDGEESEKSLNFIRSVMEEVEGLVDEVVRFEGDKNTREYKYLDEMLTRAILKLDEVDTRGDPAIRQARKDVVMKVQTALKHLEGK